MKDLRVEVRESVVSKKDELESLPLECSRMDLFSFISSTPIQYSIIFPSQKIRQSWEEEFLQVKKTADKEAPPYASVAPPTSPFPAEVSHCQEIEFRNSAILQSGKIGTVVSAPVPRDTQLIALHPVSPIVRPDSPILCLDSPTWNTQSHSFCAFWIIIEKSWEFQQNCGVSTWWMLLVFVWHNDPCGGGVSAGIV